jgi:ribosomal protein S18 acetylase RimI-like enzyme
MRISKNRLKRIIREEKEKVLDEIDLENPDGSNGDHHWPRISWDSSVGELVDKWHDMESAAFDAGDPSMTDDGELSQADAKDWWREQVDAASYDLENDITVEIRKAVLTAMKSVSGKLVNGDYA